jgi:hypothetical protein
VTTSLIAAAPEPIEQPLPFRERNAGAGVFDREHDPCTDPTYFDAHRAALARVLASVVHEHGRETVDPLSGCRDYRGGHSNTFQLQVE